MPAAPKAAAPLTSILTGTLVAVIKSTLNVCYHDFGISAGKCYYPEMVDE
jgi:hypothetical protein